MQPEGHSQEQFECLMLQHILFNVAAVDLNLVITPENLAPMLRNSEVRSQLIPFLPAGQELPQDEEQLLLTLQSPHFQQVSSVKNTL